VKTTDPNASVYLAYPERVALLRNAVDLHASCQHPLLPELLNVIESEAGPLLVYEWVDGELLRAEKGNRQSAHERFRRLPVAEIRQSLDRLYHLHATLADAGYVAVDFYDGCLIYDFDTHKLQVVDLDHYHRGPFLNEMGRMFGSSRFMAPEEFEMGARLDERTTIFNLGRAASLFLGDGHLEPEGFRGSPVLYEVMVRACQKNRSDRQASVAEFNDAWQTAGR
jgi:serine/threonine-protein kinase